MSKTYEFYVDTGYVGCQHRTVVSVPDDTTDDQLEEMAEEYRNERIDYGYFPSDEEPEEDWG